MKKIKEIGFFYGSSELKLLRLPILPQHEGFPLEDLIITASVTTQSDSQWLQKLLALLQQKQTRAGFVSQLLVGGENSRSAFCNSAGALVDCVVVGGEETSRDFRCEGERRYRTLISLLGSLATMSRVVNYHSSWARQHQVELFDASGNPCFTAVRGFNPAGGAPGGG
ncbi:hypothetical protein F511_12993 [Dorcoceras hygrometricum]|uniref:Uncharacterized protein n=1 Tax=Dorcoceras hygrometricum TaxID=472368 RepID=A0A2Z7BX45_9LAMI|nr:hypothetical protein F511_12993 [Dorcoceras hygrometricum]